MEDTEEQALGTEDGEVSNRHPLSIISSSSSVFLTFSLTLREVLYKSMELRHRLQVNLIWKCVDIFLYNLLNVVKVGYSRCSNTQPGSDVLTVPEVVPLAFRRQAGVQVKV